MYTSELYWQLSSVDLTRSVYITPHVTFRFQGFNQITSLDTLIVIVELRLASLLWERVYPALLRKWRLLLWGWPVPDLMWAVPTIRRALNLIWQHSYYRILLYHWGIFWTEAWLEIRFNNRFYNHAMYYTDRCIILYVAYWEACVCFTFST
jgi:hypothetical protein